MSEALKVGEIDVDVNVDTRAVDGLIDKFEDLEAVTSDLSPMVSFRYLRGCTINVYASRNTWTGGDSDDDD